MPFILMLGTLRPRIGVLCMDLERYIQNSEPCSCLPR